MTDKEKVIVMARTGICMLTSDKFQIFHKYVEDIMGRPVLTHEIGLLANTIKEKSKADFIALCADESSSAELPKYTNPLSPKVNDSVKPYTKIDAIIIPEGATNGDIFKIVFGYEPAIDAVVCNKEDWCGASEPCKYCISNPNNIGREEEWWNAPYKEVEE